MLKAISSQSPVDTETAGRLVQANKPWRVSLPNLAIPAEQENSEMLESTLVM